MQQETPSSARIYENRLAARDQLGSLQRSSDPLAGGEGLAAPPQIPNPAVGPSGFTYRGSWGLSELLCDKILHMPLHYSGWQFFALDSSR